MREHFQNSTILMIAHRLDTIIDADLLLVLAEGELVERGSPHALLTSAATELAEQSSASEALLVTGQFASMVEHTGKESAARLRDIAAGVAKGRLAQAHEHPLSPSLLIGEMRA